VTRAGVEPRPSG